MPIFITTFCQIQHEIIISLIELYAPRYTNSLVNKIIYIYDTFEQSIS